MKTNTIQHKVSYYGMQLQVQNRGLKKSLRKKLQMKGLQNIMNEQEEAMDLLLKKSKYYDNSKNLSKEIATIKTQLLFLVSRLDRIEQEMEYQKKIYDNRSGWRYIPLWLLDIFWNMACIANC
jgi:hypothetical protein